MSWEEVRIGEVIKVTSGGTPSRKKAEFYNNGTIPWIKTGDLKGKYANIPEEFITEAALKNSSAKLFPKGTVLLAMYGATIGACSIMSVDAATNQACGALLPSEKVDEVFLYYYLLSIKGDLIKMGVGGAQPNISGGIIKNTKIPVPPLEMQKKIAAILDAADAYRQKTKSLIEKYDELTQSLFLEMFGDPVTNPKGWKMKAASEYYEVRGRVGWKGYKKTDLRDEGAIVLGATHITKAGSIDLSKVVYLSDEKYEESPEIVVNHLDLIFVQRGNTIGKIALVRDALGKATINPVVLIFRPVNSNPFFLLYLLMNKRLNREFVNSNSGSAQPMITQKTMKEFNLIDVPISLQNEFASRIQKIETQKAQAQQSLEKAEELFASLLQRAFKGELV